MRQENSEKTTRTERSASSGEKEAKKSGKRTDRMNPEEQGKADVLTAFRRQDQPSRKPARVVFSLKTGKRRHDLVGDG